MLLRATFGDGGITEKITGRYRKSFAPSFPTPKRVKINLGFCGNEAAISCVKVGDEVFRGRKIADFSPENRFAVPVYSSICGKITEIGENYIVITSDKKSGDEKSSEEKCCFLPALEGTLADMQRENLISRLRESGIICHYDGYPMWRNIAESVGRVNELAVSAVSYSPDAMFSSQLLAKEGEKIIGGIKILLRAIGIRHASVVTDTESKRIISHFKDDIAEYSDSGLIPIFDRMISLVQVKPRYPQGDRRLVIYALGGPSIPKNYRPYEIGYCTVSIEDCIAVYDAFILNKPQTAVPVSIVDDIKRTNVSLFIPNGTELSSVSNAFGINPDKMHICIDSTLTYGASLTESPYSVKTDSVLLTTEALRFFSKEQKLSSSDCIRCGKCVDVCPMLIQPVYLYRYANAGNKKMCARLNIDACNGCGCCSYICPARLPLAEAIGAFIEK